MANTDTQLARKTMPPISRLPIYAFVIGAAIIAAMLGAELIGLNSLIGEEGGAKHRLIQIGLAIMAIGAAADLTLGQRYLLDWLKPLALDWQGLLKFIAIAVQLSLLVVVMQMSFLEHSAFYHNVMLLTLYGFIIHYFLPLPYRLPFFLLLSLGGILGVFGLADGAWLIGVSLALIGICHLPIAFWLRVASLLLAVAALIAMRTGYLQTPWTKAVWPVLASMFMFRMIVYLYDLKHKKAPTGFSRTLSYFFLLPNIAFPLFPVVDYSTFCRTYYDDDRHRIYQTGLRWMFWGVVHLLIYRYINYYWVITPEKVQSTGSLVQYMASNYLLFIRMTGQFHIIVGILHLFGFNLPRIMDNFLLSISFTDYWRRVNVYWKDFVQKVFYYPAYFKMRKVGNITKLALATLLGFVMTWFFHGYQWFWIRGSFMLSAPDILFWLGMGLFVLINSLYEAKHGRQRALVKRAATLGEIGLHALRASGIFVVMTILWSIWISPSLEDWVVLLSGAKVTGLGVLAALAAITVVLGAAMLVYEKWIVPANEAKAVKPAKVIAPRGAFDPAFFRLAMPLAAAIALLYFLVQPEFSYRLGTRASHLIVDLKTNRLNERDEALLQKGYYENLGNVNQFNSQLGELYAQRPDDWLPLTQTAAIRRTDDMLRYELLPLLDGSIKYAPFITNRWGMRDDDCEKTPAPGAYRIALLGGSVEIGSGIMHEETFEYLLEKRLNREHAGAKYDRYEILNFSVSGYHILQQLINLERKVLDFQPHAVFCVAHASEEGRKFFKSPLTPKEIDPKEIPYEGLREILARAGVQRVMKTSKVAQLLEPYNEEIMEWAYGRIVEQCRQRNILPVWICLPSRPGINDSAQAVNLVRAAEQAGFNVLNLTNVYDRAKGAYLQLAPWDKHPNARGHWLIAEGIYEALRKKADKIPLGLSAGASVRAFEPNLSTSK